MDKTVERDSDVMHVMRRGTVLKPKRILLNRELQKNLDHVRSLRRERDRLNQLIQRLYRAPPEHPVFPYSPCQRRTCPKVRSILFL